VRRTLTCCQTRHENTGAKMAMTLRNVLGKESITRHPFGLSDAWILIAGYFASDCANWIKSSSGGASIEIGKIALHVVTGLNEFRQFNDNHPLGYVFEARKLSRER
jgi:hypothetical protein